jgi:hypothetical protein
LSLSGPLPGKLASKCAFPFKPQRESKETSHG